MLALAIFLPSLAASSANVALPTLAEAFGTSFQAVRWVVIAYLLAVTLCVVAAGRLGDFAGRRRLLLAALALFATASLLCAIAPTLRMLVAGRAAQGVGAAILLAMAMAMSAELAPQGDRGRAMGVIGAASAAGTALGPALGGLLIALLGWRSIFVANLPLALLAFHLARLHLPPDGPRSAGARMPLRSMFLSPALASSLATSLVVAAVVMTTLVVGPFYLSRALGLDPAAVGVVLSAGPLAASLAGIPAGRLCDRFGGRRTSVAGLAAMTAACGALSVLSSASGIPGYVAPVLLLTAGYALFQTANNVQAMGSVPDCRRGAAAGLLNLSRNMGLIAGAWAMGAVFELGAGTSDVMAAPPEAVAAGLRVTFAAAALLLAAAILLSAGVRKCRTGQRLSEAAGTAS